MFLWWEGEEGGKERLGRWEGGVGKVGFVCFFFSVEGRGGRGGDEWMSTKGVSCFDHGPWARAMTKQHVKSEGGQVGGGEDMSVGFSSSCSDLTHSSREYSSPREELCLINSLASELSMSEDRLHRSPMVRNLACQMDFSSTPASIGHNEPI